MSEEQTGTAATAGRVLRIVKWAALALWVASALLLLFVLPQSDRLLGFQALLTLITAFTWLLSYVGLSLRGIGTLIGLIGLPILAEITCEMGGPTTILFGVGLIAHIIARRRRRRLKPTIERVLKYFVASSATVSAVLWVLSSLCTFSIDMTGWHIPSAEFMGIRGCIDFSAYWESCSISAFSCNIAGFKAADEVDWGLDWSSFEFSDFPPICEVTFVIPLWMPTLFFAAWSYVLWTQPRSNKPGICGECGYDLRGNTTGRCPECGMACVQEVQTEHVIEQANPRDDSRLPTLAGSQTTSNAARRKESDKHNER